MTDTPITLAEAKAQCRIDGTDEDTLVAGNTRNATGDSAGAYFKA